MFVTIEISYYPLADSYNEAVKSFLQQMEAHQIDMQVGSMSTLITGEFRQIMPVLTAVMDGLMQSYPSVFNLKISNSCPV